MNTPKNGKYDKLASNFWSNVDFILKERGMTWRELAGKLGVDPRTLSSKKAGNSNVSIGSAKDIAEAIGTSVDRLVYGRPENI
jgi:transcriptional regulator with XRE-family HTH domain